MLHNISCTFIILLLVQIYSVGLCCIILKDVHDAILTFTHFKEGLLIHQIHNKLIALGEFLD